MPMSIEQKDVEKFISENGSGKFCKFCSKKFKTTKVAHDCCSKSCEEEYLKADVSGMFISFCEVCNTRMCTKKPSTTNKCRTCLSSSKYKIFRKDKFEDSNELLEMKSFYVKSNYNLSQTGAKFSLTGNSVKKILKRHCSTEWKEWEIIKTSLRNSQCKICSLSIKKYNVPGVSNVYCSESCKRKDKKYHYDEKAIYYSMKKYKNNVSRTAKELGLSRKSLANWLKKQKT